MTVAVALLRLERVPEAATVWAVCELGFDELSSPPHGAMLEWYEAVRVSLDDEELAAGRRRAARMGLEQGLAWVGQVARGERTPPLTCAPRRRWGVVSRAQRKEEPRSPRDPSF